MIHIVAEKNIQQIIVTDLQGKEIIRSAGSESLKMGDFEEGIYLMKIVFDKGLAMKKLVIAR